MKMTATKMTRRQGLQAAAGLAAAGAPGLGAGLSAAAPSTIGGSALGAPRRLTRTGGGIQFATMNSYRVDHKARISKQIGVNYAICGAGLGRVAKSEYEATLAKMKADFASIGIEVAGVESHPVPAEKIKLGEPGRDEEIENYIAAIKALGNVGIKVLCYNFMAGLGWYRTQVDRKGRGNSLLTDFDLAAAKAQGLTKWGEVPEEKIWQNIEYFLKAVIPVAEKAGVMMALHPDDPPLSPLRGIGRIVTSAANYRKIMNLVPSPVNGVTFCQANFIAMGEDCVQLVREWGKQKKIFFVHFRDIAGTREHFTETFHDEGQTDMVKMLKTYHEVGFKGPMRPDHAPTLDEETNDRPGYAIQGKIFAIGYMKGVMQGLGLPYA
ncbi:MAG: mannonate dehydratase [Bryobacterales bacterium]|nr:mannonate dehydratase [Bryobacterales bacterium]